MLSAELHGEAMKVMLPMMMIKLYTTKVMEKVAEAAYDIIGGEGLLDIDTPEMGVWATGNDSRTAVQNYLFSLGPSIAGGASNIQRNIIGERGLGLPRDLRKDAPYCGYENFDFDLGLVEGLVDGEDRRPRDSPQAGEGPQG